MQSRKLLTCQGQYFRKLMGQPIVKTLGNFMDLSSWWEAPSSAGTQELPGILLEPKGSSLWSKKPSTASYPETDKCSQFNPILSLQDYSKFYFLFFFIFVECILLWYSNVYFPNIYPQSDRLCGLVVRVLGYRSGGLGSIPGTTRKKK
jgi:hypothetical protein